MFTAAERDHVRESLVEMAREDKRVVAAALVGATARGGGDRWSDVDLTLGLADDADMAEVLGDWTRDLGSRFAAVHLFDLPVLSTVYRVFLLPGRSTSHSPFLSSGHLGQSTGPPRTVLGDLGPRRAPSPSLRLAPIWGA